MTVSGNWQREYAALGDFIAAHAEIRIEPDRVSLPDGVRADFYRLFDAVTAALVRAHRAILPSEAAQLCHCYRQAEQEASALLGVSGVSMPAGLSAFLHNPEHGLARVLFDELFALLQGKVDRETFEKRVPEKLTSTVAALSRFGYPYWVALSVLTRLEPDAAFQVALDSEARPVLTEPELIPFGHPAPHPTLRLPELIVHSCRLNKHIALKLELGAEILTYTTDARGERKEAIRNAGVTSAVLGPRVLLLYALAQPHRVPVLADLATRRVAHPDLVIECPGPMAHDQEAVGKRCDVLRPARGTYLVFRETVPAPYLGRSGEYHRPLVVGLDPARLEPPISALADGEADHL